MACDNGKSERIETHLEIPYGYFRESRVLVLMYLSLLIFSLIFLAKGRFDAITVRYCRVQ